ncbi:hypothetical protein CMO90_03320 [Candidatus Woesearchaeota archaeon]|jgi:hypothetical protein|nr:hypothetical protein [Candidatus Woesearchaeota archaeon]|tara:strand:- start:546 stop:968 length:423 start_codon:yes stop_codon:yes gene_type:complete
MLISANIDYDTYGIEIDSNVKSLADKVIKIAEEQNLILKKSINVYQGNMFNLESYEQTGKKFDDFNIFYLYALRGSQEKFIPLYSEKAKQGSKLIIVPGFKKSKKEAMLKKYYNLEIFFEKKEDSSYELAHSFYQIYEKK